MKKAGILFVLIILLIVNVILTGELKVTQEHPFFVNGEWVTASQLSVGDELITSSDEKVKIISIKDVSSPIEVYNLDSSETDDFIVGEENIVVHNSNRNINLLLCDSKVKESVSILEEYGYDYLTNHYLEFIRALEKDGLTYDEITFGGTGQGFSEILALTLNVNINIPSEILGRHPDLVYFFSIENPKILKAFPITKDHESHPFKEIYGEVTRLIRKWCD